MLSGRSIIFDRLIQQLRHLPLFWQRHPCLFLGLHLYIGTSLLFQQNGWVLVLGIPLWAYQRPRWCAFGVLVAGLVVGWSAWMHRLPQCPSEGIQGQALIAVQGSSFRQSHFGRGWLLRGSIREFRVDDRLIGQGIPVAVYLPQSTSLPIPGVTYRVVGRLKQQESGTYILKVRTKETWEVVGQPRPLQKWRYLAKRSLKKRLEKRMGQGQTTVFLTGLATGDFSDPQILMSLGRFSLQHLMAISGFHFSILAAAFGMMVRPWLRGRKGVVAVAVLLSLYFGFIGPSPSVLRAWVMAMLGLVGSFLGRPARALNALGVALLVTLVLDPLAVSNLGFQFSFCCTAALLLACGPIERVLWPLWRVQKLNSETSLAGKCRFMGSLIVNKAIATAIGVNLTAAPLTLFYYHRFPLTGVVLNLLFPAMVGGLMMLLGIALVLEGAIPFLGGGSFVFLKWIGKHVLELPVNLPAYFDFYWRARGVPVGLLAVCGAALLTACAVSGARLYGESHGRAHPAVLFRRRPISSRAAASRAESSTL